MLLNIHHLDTPAAVAKLCDMLNSLNTLSENGRNRRSQATLRLSPTQKQLAAISTLTTEALLPLACQCLHSLNRRAKKLRDDRKEYQRYAETYQAKIDRIYTLKDKLLLALVKSGRATVETFEIEGRSVCCSICQHNWCGDNYCYRCDENSGEAEQEQWFIISAPMGYRYHTPHWHPAYATATPIKAHDPTQEQREIPKILSPTGKGRLTIEAQHACLSLAIARLSEPMEQQHQEEDDRQLIDSHLIDDYLNEAISGDSPTEGKVK